MLFLIRLKFFLEVGGAEGAILAKRPFTLLRLATASRSAAQTPLRSLRIKGGETLFLKKLCSVKFNKFGFKFDREIPKQVLVVKFYRTIRHKILNLAQAGFWHANFIKGANDERSAESSRHPRARGAVS